MELTARIHIEEGGYWADVPELPGCFASGDTLDELFESVQESVAIYLADEGQRLTTVETPMRSVAFPRFGNRALHLDRSCRASARATRPNDG